MIANLKDTYTSDEVRLMMLEEGQSGIKQEIKNLSNNFDRRFESIDKKLDKIGNKIETMDHKFDAKIDKLYWFIIGLYGTAALALLKPFIFK